MVVWKIFRWIYGVWKLFGNNYGCLRFLGKIYGSENISLENMGGGVKYDFGKIWGPKYYPAKLWGSETETGKFREFGVKKLDILLFSVIFIFRWNENGFDKNYGGLIDFFSKIMGDWIFFDKNYGVGVKFFLTKITGGWKFFDKIMGVWSLMGKIMGVRTFFWCNLWGSEIFRADNMKFLAIFRNLLRAGVPGTGPSHNKWEKM